ncbi:MAG: type IV secretory system conjugative DNA transfer family protein [Candidatus Thiodiazotropha endolucinida]
MSFPDLTKDIPRGVPTRYLKQQTPPQARFLDTASLYNSDLLSYDPDDPGRKILVGAIGDKLIGIDDNRHIMTVAGSRAGKSVNLTANLLLYRGSALVTDPKGELANISAERRAALGQKVYVLDPFNTTAERLSGFRASYNPMSALTLDNPFIIEDAGLIVEALVPHNPNEKDQHWNESSKNTLEGFILHVATDPRYEGRRNLVTVRDLIRTAMKPVPQAEDDQNEPMSVLEVEMHENAARLQQHQTTEVLGKTIEGAARDFYEKPDRERESVLSTVRRHTKFLDYPALRNILTGHDFDLRDLKRDPDSVSIYLCFPATRIEACNRWLRLFVNQLLNAMEREKTKPKAPVLACLDEFPVLGYMKTLENAAGQIASYDVKLWVILQDWSQGKALYGERWETFTGNAGFLQFFGNNDLATTEYISKRLGKTPVESTRLGEVGREQQEAGLSGRSSSVELYELLIAEEICRIFARNDKHKRQLVLWAGFHPIIVQRIEYWNKTSPVYKYFKGKFATP